MKDGNYLLYENKQVVDFLKSKGYDSMFLKENAGENNPFTTLAVFEPNNIRSVNAEFDPEKKDSPQILASAPFAAGAAGLGAAAVLSSEDAEAGGMGVRSRRMPDDVAFKAAPKKESPRTTFLGWPVRFRGYERNCWHNLLAGQRELTSTCDWINRKHSGCS
jgi:hypothetical protein